MDSFPIEIHDKLGWYVYRLIDPRNGQTFYIGKGRGDRVFQHIRGALSQEDSSGEMDFKRTTILDIARANLPVVHVIHRHGLKSPEIAYEVEAALISIPRAGTGDDSHPQRTGVAPVDDREITALRLSASERPLNVRTGFGSILPVVI